MRQFLAASYFSLPNTAGLTIIRLVKTRVKILGAIVAVAFFGLGSMYVLRTPEEPAHCSSLRLTGRRIEPSTFVEARALIEAKECLGRPADAKRLFVVEDSEGGNGPSALAIGILLHKYNWDVEVVDLCASSCANYIFPAGKTKYLRERSMLMFHGGPHQEGLLESIEKFEREMAVNGAPATPVVLGQKDKEGYFEYDPGKQQRTPEGDAVLEFLSLSDVQTQAEGMRRFRDATDRFYRELGVNPLLPTYGQIGAYRPIYKSGKYFGFIYSLDSLRKLGLGNIELTDGEWHPERHPEYPKFYDVTYP
jgi:hypothetical protein